MYYLRNYFAGRVAVATALDLCCFVAATALVWHLTHPIVSGVTYAVGAAVGWLLLAATLQFFDAYSLRTLGHARRALDRALASTGLIAGAIAGAYFVLPVGEGLLITPATVAAVFFPLHLVNRVTLRAIYRNDRDRVLILGTSDLGFEVARVIRERPNLGIGVVGFLSDDAGLWGSLQDGVPVLGSMEVLEKVIGEEQISLIVVASKDRNESYPGDVLLNAKLGGIRVESGISFFERNTGRVYLRDLRSSYLTFSDGFRSNALENGLRRLIDVAVAASALVVLSPVLAVAALAVRLDSRGPVLFSQIRQGKGGRSFRIFKLRTMRVDAERDTGPVWAKPNDDRTTRVGRLLRKTRFDEIPQLWNVLVGEMSLVGPRPERSEFNDELVVRYPYFRVRSAVKPGLTGWAQVRYGYVGDTERYEEKLALDLYYVKNRSLFLDLVVLWTTVKTVLLMKGQ